MTETITTSSPYSAVDHWEWHSYTSGTQVIVPIPQSWDLPYLYVYGPPGKDEGDTYRMRSMTCQELCMWLNGGAMPAWFNDLQRVSETQLDGLDGTTITAVGLFIDANPPACQWAQDDSWHAHNLRAKLIDYLMAKRKAANA